jgi:hypothetical protein
MKGRSDQTIFIAPSPRLLVSSLHAPILAKEGWFNGYS